MRRSPDPRRLTIADLLSLFEAPKEPPAVTDLLWDVVAWAPAVILAITLHEAAHGWAAFKLGDDTAMRLGRVTANPFAHVDPVGTVLIPGMLLLTGAPFLFGWAKPVPVEVRRLRNPKRDMALVAAAGPAANFLMAFAAAVLIWPAIALEGDARALATAALENAILLNVVLMVFNLIPLPPLDGGRVLYALLPRPLALRYARLERYGLLIIFGLMIAPFLLASAGIDFNPLGAFLYPAVEAVAELILRMAGHGR